MLIVFQTIKSRKSIELLGCIDPSTQVVSVERNWLLPRISNAVFDSIHKARLNNEKIIFWPLEEHEVKKLWPIYELLSHYPRALWFSPKPALMSILSDKLEAKKLLKENGFSVLPPINKFDSQIEYVVKPKQGSGSRGVQFLKGEAVMQMTLTQDQFVEERQAFDSFHGISGVAQNGKILFMYGHKRLVTKNNFGGASRLAEYEDVNHDDFVQIKKFLNNCTYTGCFMFEYGITDDKRILIELNPRLWGSFPISFRCFSKLIKNDFSTNLVKQRYFDYYILLTNFYAFKFLVFSAFTTEKSKIYIAPNVKNILRWLF